MKGFIFHAQTNFGILIFTLNFAGVAEVINLLYHIF